MQPTSTASGEAAALFVVLAIVALVLTVLFGTLVTVLVVTYVWAPDAGHRRRARDIPDRLQPVEVLTG